MRQNTFLKIKSRKLNIFSLIMRYGKVETAWAWLHNNRLDDSGRRRIRDVKKAHLGYYYSLSQDSLAMKESLSVYKTQLKINRLSKAQRAAYSRLSHSARENYLKSFDGVRWHSRLSRIKKDNPEVKSKVKSYLETIYKVNVDKKPMSVDLGQWIGVEIECVIPEFEEIYYYSCEDVNCHDENCDGDHGSNEDDLDNFKELTKELESRKLKHVTLKRDGSIEAPQGYFGAELTVFFKINDMSPLEKLCAALSDLGAKVNKSCGLHVHLDQRDVKESIKTVTLRSKRLSNALPVLTRLVPQSRLNNTYCRIGASKFSGCRYYAVNRTAFRKYNTLEVRLHSGTTDFKKISNWVKLLFKISRAKGFKLQSDLDSMLETLSMTDSETEYFLKRAAQFSGQVNSQVQEAS